jgi:hypothetical protein
VKLTDDVKGPTGRFVLNVFKHGQLIERFEEDNLVVDASKQPLAKLLGGSVTNQSVTQIAFGTNGTAPANSNTAITSPYTKGFDSVTYPASNQVSFNFSLGSTEDNGVAIIEFGLLTAAGALFARKVRSSALNKDTDISFTGSWIISF